MKPFEIRLKNNAAIVDAFCNDHTGHRAIVNKLKTHKGKVYVCTGKRSKQGFQSYSKSRIDKPYILPSSFDGDAMIIVDDFATGHRQSVVTFNLTMINRIEMTLTENQIDTIIFNYDNDIDYMISFAS